MVSLKDRSSVSINTLDSRKSPTCTNVKCANTSIAANTIWSVTLELTQERNHTLALTALSDPQHKASLTCTSEVDTKVSDQCDSCLYPSLLLLFEAYFKKFIKMFDSRIFPVTRLWIISSEDYSCDNNNNNNNNNNAMTIIKFWRCIIIDFLLQSGPLLVFLYQLVKWTLMLR